MRAESRMGSRGCVLHDRPPGRFNPAISVNHFFVPSRIAKKLGMVER
jgi:hypothetical protein